jgi:MFS family permease
VAGSRSVCLCPHISRTEFSRLYLPATASVATWFNRRRAAALGLASAGASFGSIAYPILIDNLIPRIGFGWTIRVMAFIQLLTLCIPVLASESRLPPRNTGPFFEIKAFKQPSFTLFTIGIFLACWSIDTPYYFSTAYALKVDTPQNLAPYVLPIMNVFFSSLWPISHLGCISIRTTRPEFWC